MNRIKKKILAVPFFIAILLILSILFGFFSVHSARFASPLGGCLRG
jgi:hypothetical protein